MGKTLRRESLGLRFFAFGAAFLACGVTVSLPTFAMESALASEPVIVLGCNDYEVNAQAPEAIRDNYKLKCLRQGDTFYLDGVITPELFAALTQPYPVPLKRIHLNSSGGSGVEALRIAKWIRAQKIETHVRAGAVCMSACTLLFQAGIARLAAPSALFMYHGARLPNQTPGTIDALKHCLDHPNPDCMAFIEIKRRKVEIMTQEIFDELVRMGAKPSLYAEYRLRAESPNWLDEGNYLKTEDWELDARLAAIYGIVTEVTAE